MADPNFRSSLTGLTEDEAKEVHGLFSLGFIGFTLLALVVHLLTWSWRPWGWLPYQGQLSSLDENSQVALTTLAQLIS